MQAYANEAREKWVKEWAGQVVLCVSQMYWTIEVHEALAMGPGGLRNYWDTLQLQLGKVVELVRGKLTKQQRITLGALVTIDVHARDVVNEMIEKGKTLLFFLRDMVFAITLILLAVNGFGIVSRILQFVGFRLLHNLLAVICW